MKFDWLDLIETPFRKFLRLSKKQQWKLIFYLWVVSVIGMFLFLNFVDPAAKDLCDGRLCKIIACGAKSAGRNHGASSIECLTHRLGDLVRFIPDRGAAHHFDAGSGQRARDVRGVGVYREAQEELVTNGDQLDPGWAHNANTPA